MRSFFAILLLLTSCTLEKVVMPNYEIGDDGRVRSQQVGAKPVPVVLNLSKPTRGMIGKSATVAPGETVTLIDWRTEDDESALPVTLVLGFPHSLDTPPSGGVEARKVTATVKYGIGGTQNEIRMDIYPGNMITLPATFMRVEVTADNGNLNSAEVSAFICRFAASHSPAKTTAYSTLPIITPAVEVIPIPALSRSFRGYLVLSGPAAAWQYRVLDFAGNTLFLKGMVAGSNEIPEFVLPGDASTIELGSATAGQSIDGYRLVFDLY